jgi:SAM-dependent methyltransferase
MTARLEMPAGPHLDLIEGKLGRVRAFYDALGPERDEWIARSRYYYDGLVRLLRGIVPAGQSVLDVGCGNGDQLTALEPSLAVGVDVSQGMIDLARRKHPHLELHRQAAEELSLPAHEVHGETGGFDFVLMVNVIGEIADVLEALKRLRPLARADTRLVIVYYNHLWEPLIPLAASLSLKLNNPTQNWFSPGDVHGLLHLAGFEVVTTGVRTPCPKYVPGLAELMNDVLGRLPLLERLGFVRFLVARPNMAHPPPPPP